MRGRKFGPMVKRVIIEVGTRFQSVGRSMYGKPRSTYWRVAAVSTRADGLVHATLVEEQNPYNVKTLAAAALLDRRHFLPAEAAA